jgi:hypothetical protein
MRSGWRAAQSERPGLHRAREPASVAGLGAVCVAALGGSHLLAKRVGAWASVVAAVVVSVAVREVVTRVGDRQPKEAVPICGGVRAGSKFPHRIPTTPGLEGRSPQKTHGQNGLIRRYGTSANMISSVLTAHLCRSTG